ncbi:MAG: hypothetical protein BRD38_04045 [Bacteroidetes bacterium QH_9_67_14]|nr:MAG: hypothetical protein BRD38_04045 [Bacteroidetes bacterium QH_9_67_14]
MPRDGTELLAEARIRGALPDGFKSTIADSNRLRQLSNADLNNITEVVDDYSGNDITERDLIRLEIQEVMTAFQTPERTIELPATGLEFERLQRFASYYKADNDTPSGTIKNLRRASVDDIIFTFASPEVYDEITGTAQSNFMASGLTGGNPLEVIDQDGLPDGGQTADTTLELDDDEMLYFTGDYIDLSDGQSVVTKIQWSDIDGEDYGPDDGILSNRLSGTHLFAGQGAWVKSTADLDAKIYDDGDAELVPVAFYMGPGTKVPSLV